jgi:hypothetical protein
MHNLTTAAVIARAGRHGIKLHVLPADKEQQGPEYPRMGGSLRTTDWDPCREPLTAYVYDRSNGTETWIAYVRMAYSL